MTATAGLRERTATLSAGVADVAVERAKAALAAVPDEQVEEMLKQHEDAALASMLVRALMSARKLQAAVKVGGLRPKGLALNIGLSPSVAVKFG
jgi:hypothetical protein